MDIDKGGWNLPNKRIIYSFLAVCMVIFLYLVGSWTIFRHTATVTFPGEGTYSGELKGKVFDGRGTFKSVMGVTYTGQFKEGAYHGQGTMTYANGDKYIGEWKHGKMDGKGTIIHKDGSKIKGLWEHGKLKKNQ